MRRIANILRAWRYDGRGISSVEFALVAAVFFLFIFGIIDFGRAMWEWNMAQKATHRGVRYAVVNDPVATAVVNFNGLDYGSAGSSIPISSGGAPVFPDVVCAEQGGAVGCGSSLSTLAAANANPDAFYAILGRVQAIYDRVEGKNLVVEYRNVGLGFAGNPVGPDIEVATTVRLRDMTFGFVTPGFAGIVSIEMPDFDATMTGEDQFSL